jgi:hypothetical protein
MGIPLTRTEPPKPGMVRFKPGFGAVEFLEGRGLDSARITVQIGERQVSVALCAPSGGPGPGDFKAGDVLEMLRTLATKIEMMLVKE